MLEKMMKELNEMNRLAQVYYENEQWALLERVMKSIRDYSKMIYNNLEQNEREIPIDSR